ncbi:MAG TPA: PAS domain S-box protein, partial [Rhodocyclaceae bacterium]|nr:PAS domain S-box protein [Rhodocyclaceae bacterium]
TKGVITHANQRMAEMFGCPMASRIGSEYIAHVHPAERETGRQRMLNLLASAIPAVDLERHYWRDDGSEFWGHLTGRRFQGAHGEELGLLGVIADIDQRKRAAEALAFSQQQFRDLVDSTAGIVWEGDARTFDFTFVSQEAERLLGYPVAEWTQPGFWVAHLHPDDLGWAPEYCAAYTARREAHDFEYRFVAKDGRTVWLRDIVKVVEENGQPRWLRGVMVDVTEQKRARERHSQVIETSMDGFIVIGADGRFRECNDAVCALTGYSRTAFLERSLNDLDASECPEQLAAHLDVIMKAGFDRFETVWRRRAAPAR